MPHILQGDNFFFNILLRELFSCNVLVLHVIRAVYAPVYTIVGEIERCEHNDSVAVKILFDLFGKREDFPVFFFIFAVQ